jgi:hypothetical protein
MIDGHLRYPAGLGRAALILAVASLLALAAAAPALANRTVSRRPLNWWVRRA